MLIERKPFRGKRIRNTKEEILVINLGDQKWPRSIKYATEQRAKGKLNNSKDLQIKTNAVFVVYKLANDVTITSRTRSH